MANFRRQYLPLRPALSNATLDKVGERAYLPSHADQRRRDFLDSRPASYSKPRDAKQSLASNRMVTSEESRLADEPISKRPRAHGCPAAVRAPVDDPRPSLVKKSEDTVERHSRMTPHLDGRRKMTDETRRSVEERCSGWDVPSSGRSYHAVSL